MARRIIRPKTEVPEFEAWVECDGQRHALRRPTADTERGMLSVHALDAEEANGIAINCMSLGGRSRKKLDWYVESDEDRNFGESVFVIGALTQSIDAIEFQLTSTPQRVRLAGHASIFHLSSTKGPEFAGGDEAALAAWQAANRERLRKDYALAYGNRRRVDFVVEAPWD